MGKEEQWEVPLIAMVLPACTLMAFVTIAWLLVECDRLKRMSLLNRGYYFVEEYINLRHKRLIPVPPHNVDASDPANPRIINPALLAENPCYCCA